MSGENFVCFICMVFLRWLLICWCINIISFMVCILLLFVFLIVLGYVKLEMYFLILFVVVYGWSIIWNKVLFGWEILR